MGVIAFLVRRSLLSVGVSSAALYRSIEKWNPTFVVDEADDAFVDNPDLRQVINSGWTRGQGVMRCDPDTNEPRRFSTFCPKAIALKGKKMPDTMLSRTIFVEMKRRLKSEKVDHFRHLDDAGFARMRSQLARWAEDSGEALGAALPDQPEGFINRTASNWQLMFAIADSLGEEAGARARTVAQHIAGVTDMASAGVALLQDIKTMFDRSTLDYLTSKAIIERLTADPEKPRAEWSRGRPITEKGVAGLLHEYRISSRTVGPEGARAKGYRKADFEDAWRRYLAPQGAVSPSHSDILPFSRSALCNDYTSAEKSAVQPNDAERKKNGHFSNEIKALNGRTGNNPEIAPLDLKGSDPGPIPDCDHCGQPGTAAWPREQGLQEQAPRCDHCGGLASPADPLKPWNWPSRPDGVRLHAGCEAAFHDAEQSREMTPPPPLSNSYEVGDAADVPPPAPEPLPPQSTNGAERDVRHCAYCGQPDTAADPLHHGHWRPRKPDGDWLHAGCIDPWRAGGWRLK